MRTLNPFVALAFALACTSGFAQNTYFLSASDFEFDPLVLNINAGDTVRVALDPGHGFREVSQTTWDLNVGSPGTGWEFNPSSQLEIHDLVTTIPGTIYYVCPQHVSMGMKGRIVVAQGTIGLSESNRPQFRIQPNPATGTIWITDLPVGAVRARVVDAMGRVRNEQALMPGGSVDLEELSSGTYQVILLGDRGNTIAQGSVVLMDR